MYDIYSNKLVRTLNFVWQVDGVFGIMKHILISAGGLIAE